MTTHEKSSVKKISHPTLLAACCELDQAAPERWDTAWETLVMAPGFLCWIDYHSTQLKTFKNVFKL